jgi:hypothetical protein
MRRVGHAVIWWTCLAGSFVHDDAAEACGQQGSQLRGVSGAVNDGYAPQPRTRENRYLERAPATPLRRVLA